MLRFASIPLRLSGIILLSSLVLSALTSCVGKISAVPSSNVSAVRVDNVAKDVSGTSDLLNAAQKASLKKLGIPVVLPTYVPNEFRLSRVIANTCPQGGRAIGTCREGASYTIVYRNAQNTCLLVNATGGGVGGGAAEYEFQTEPALLGAVTILFGNRSGANQAPTSAQLRIPQHHLSSFPATIKSRKTPYYNVVVGESTYYQETYGCGRNTSVTPLELEKMVQSLRLIK